MDRGKPGISSNVTGAMELFGILKSSTLEQRYLGSLVISKLGQFCRSFTCVNDPVA
jgi:hypothetical protein